MVDFGYYSRNYAVDMRLIVCKFQNYLSHFLQNYLSRFFQNYLSHWQPLLVSGAQESI